MPQNRNRDNPEDEAERMQELYERWIAAKPQTRVNQQSEQNERREDGHCSKPFPHKSIIV